MTQPDIMKFMRKKTVTKPQKTVTKPPDDSVTKPSLVTLGLVTQPKGLVTHEAGQAYANKGGRPTIGEKAMTPAEKQKRYRARKKSEAG